MPARVAASRADAAGQLEQPGEDAYGRYGEQRAGAVGQGPREERIGLSKSPHDLTAMGLYAILPLVAGL